MTPEETIAADDADVPALYQRIDMLTERVNEYRQRVISLRKSVDALPHTRDNHPITPGMVVYERRSAEAFEVLHFHQWESPADYGNPSKYKWTSIPLAVCKRAPYFDERRDATDCFADPDAARAAKWSDK